MRFTKVVGLLLSGCFVVVSLGAKVQGATPLLTVNQSNVFGFEDPAQWQSSVALSSSTTHTQGASSLAVKAKGYTEVTSVALPSLTGVSGTLTVDVLLPSPQPNPSWYGFIQLLVSVPSKGINNAFVGQQELTGQPLNQFFSLNFSVPQSLVTPLQAGGYSDFKIKIVANVPSNATGTYLFDNLRFGGTPPVGCGDFVEGNILANWTWGAVDAPATTLSLLSGSDVVRGQQALRAVTAAAFDFWLRYTAPQPIDASTSNELRVAVRGLNTTPSGWQGNMPSLVVEDTSGARIQLTPTTPILSRDGITWVVASVPVPSGSPGWVVTGGPIQWNAVHAIEVHADTFESGFTLDVDAMSFERSGTVCACAAPCGTHGTCDQSSLSCDCNLGWAGNTCATCATGFVLQGGACALVGDGSSSVWPNAFSKATSDPWLAVHHDEIQTVSPNVLVLDFVNVSSPTQDIALVNQIIAATAEASRMQGFQNPSQPSQLHYQVAKLVDLRDGVNGRPPAPAGYPFQNSTLYPTSAALGGRAAGASVDYAAFYNQSFAALYGYPDPAQAGRFLTLCELVERGIVHDVWVVGSGDVTDAGMAEVLESKQRYNPLGNKIPGSFEPCAGNGCFRPEVPVCGRSLRIGFVNYNRGPGCFVHSLGHGMESAMGGVKAPWVQHNSIFAPMESWFIPFATLNLDVKYNLPFSNLEAVQCAPEPDGSGEFCLSYPTPTSISINDSGTILTVDPWDAVCGNVHLMPDAHGQYDVCGDGPPDIDCNQTVSTPVSTSCIGYGRHAGPGGTDAKQIVTAANWWPYDAIAGDCQGAFQVWWQQNMPMFGSGQTLANGQKMKSVWPYLYY